MFKFGRAMQVVATSILLVACSEPPESPGPDVRKEPVVVFAAFEDDEELRQLMARYTDESGVRVIIRRGAAAGIVNDLIENKISPAADVLMTRSVVDVWRAAEEGALRAIQSDSMSERVPEWARDPDNLWASTDFHTAVIAYNDADLAVDQITGYASLADPQFEGSLCMSSSKSPVNQLLIAMLIDELGVRDAQTVVRGWMKNLAFPAGRSDDEVVVAIATGLCKVGFVSSTANTAGVSNVSLHSPDGAFADVDGIGIGRHAHNPDGALALLEWLLAQSAESNFRKAANVSEKNVSLFAWHQRDAVLLAERVRYP
jgi:iron(III) transport system substrate-binding protein